MDTEIETCIKSLKKLKLSSDTFDQNIISKNLFSQNQIKKIIPHRFPFIFLHNIKHLSLQDRLISGEHIANPRNPVFKGHFPGNPVFPGVLQVELMAQLGLCLSWFVLNNTENITVDAKPILGMITKIHYSAFFRPILPGNILTVYSKLISIDDWTGIVAGQVFVKNDLCSCSIVEAYYNE